jgi:hypothetical protein
MFVVEIIIKLVLTLQVYNRLQVLLIGFGINENGWKRIKKLPGCLDYGRVMFVSHKKIALIYR